VVVLNALTGPGVVQKFDAQAQGDGVKYINWAWCGVQI
jgi:hypothetical protein